MKLISLTIAAVIALGGPAWAKDGHVLVKPHRHHLGLMPIKRAVYKDQADCTVVLQDGGTLSKALVHGQVCAVPGASHVSITWNEIHDPMAFTALVAAPQPLSKTGFAGLFGSLPSISGLVNKIISDGVSKIIPDLQSADSVASAIDPNSKQPAPYNTYLPLYHQCAVVAVPWLQSLPSPVAVPKPTGSGGIVTNAVVTLINIEQTHELIQSLETNGFGVQLHAACDAFALQLLRTPQTVVGNFNQDFVGLVQLIAAGN